MHPQLKGNMYTNMPDPADIMPYYDGILVIGKLGTFDPVFWCKFQAGNIVSKDFSTNHKVFHQFSVVLGR